MLTASQAAWLASRRLPAGRTGSLQVLAALRQQWQARFPDATDEQHQAAQAQLAVLVGVQ